MEGEGEKGQSKPSEEPREAFCVQGSYLEDPQEVLKVRNHLRHVVPWASDSRLVPPAYSHIAQILAGQPPIVPKVSPEIVPVPRVQEVQVRFADLDVIGGGARVELLVPLRQEGVVNAGPVALPDAVRPQDVQDSHPYVITVAPAPRQRRHRQPEEVAGEQVNLRVRDAGANTLCKCSL